MERERKIKQYLIIIICGLLSVLATSVGAQTAQEWLSRIDEQTVMESAEYRARMTVHSPNGKERMFAFEGKVKGEDAALLEFTDPPSQRGVRYLKREGSLWIYFPRQDRTMQIQGHMLREGVQGGDLSYEDMTESKSQIDKYDAQITGETDSTVTIELTAKDMTVSYPHRTLVVDKQKAVMLHVLNKSADGTPIKEINTLKIEKLGGRWFATQSEIRSSLIGNRWTRFEIDEIKFDVKFPDETFTKRMLER